MSIKNIPIIGKFLIIFGLFAALAISAVIFSTQEMRRIEAGYAGAIAQQGAAALALARGNRALNTIYAAIAEIEIENTDAGIAAAVAAMKSGRAAFIDFLTAAKTADPARAAKVDDLLRRGLDIVDTVCAPAITLGQAATQPAALLAAQAEYLKACGPAFGPLTAEMTAQVGLASAAQDAIGTALRESTSGTILTTYAVILGGLLALLIGGYWAMRTWISGPLRGLATVMDVLARNDFSVTVSGVEQKDEVGLMGRAVQVFKTNGLRLQASELEAERIRQVAERERAATEAARIETARQQQGVVAAVARGLDRLAAGDLTQRLSEPFEAGYEKLRADFNATAASLEAAIGTIVTATGQIDLGSDEISKASEDLARRTEQQAANLEETAAALSQITAAVRKTAAGAGEALSAVVGTRQEAEASGEVVRQAVAAMGKIEESSREIGQIIGVIDEIAFQTNLLALNAGVEAARAGETGRGFAVVASEVRALAQRSAEAAKQIKVLILASAEQVEGGVEFVGRTGVTLHRIAERVTGIDQLIKDISASAKEQSAGLEQVNTAVSQMDQVVQHNAAMVEQSSVAIRSLKQEVTDLATIIRRFKIGASAADGSARSAGAGNPVHAVQAKLAGFARAG